MRQTWHRAAPALALGLSLMAACGGSDPLGPADIAGSYVATVFTVTQGTQVTDFLAEGGSLTIALSGTGTTTGQLVVPASLTGSVPEVTNLQGTFAIAGQTVDFDMTADTFVRDLSFTIGDNTLSGAGVFSGVHLSVTLTRQ